MRITFEQIRKALVAIADQKGRPHYEMGVVREVADAIQNNTHHHLKIIVMQEIYVQFSHLYKKEKPKQDINLDEALESLLVIKNYYAGQKVLVSRSGVSERTVSLLLRKKQELSPRIWSKIEPVLESVLQELARHHSEKEKNSHGKYVTYRKGCRCDSCRAAWRYYIKERKTKRGQ